MSDDFERAIGAIGHRCRTPVAAVVRSIGPSRPISRCARGEERSGQHRLADRERAVAHHLVARAGGVAGVAQIETVRVQVAPPGGNQ